MRLYLDTNVIVDIIENRDPSSYDLLCKSLRCAHTIVLSSWTYQELLHIGYGQQASTFLKMLERHKKISWVKQASSDALMARTVSTHHADAIHYLIAKRSAEAIVTRNIKDFPFTDILIKRPEEL